MKTIALVMLGTFLMLSGTADARRHRHGHHKKHTVVVVQEPARHVVVVAPPRPTVVVRAPSVTISH